MIDREKVIKGLECYRMNPDPEHCEKNDCPYNNNDPHYGYWCCSNRLLHDAVRLLKEQEPRVMTLEEVREWKQPDVWIENDKANFIGDYIEPAGRMEFAFLSSIVVGNKKHPDGTPITMDEQYGKKWRCWTARPTDKQREETPWEK